MKDSSASSVDGRTAAASCTTAASNARTTSSSDRNQADRPTPTTRQLNLRRRHLRWSLRHPASSRHPDRLAEHSARHSPDDGPRPPAKAVRRDTRGIDRRRVAATVAQRPGIARQDRPAHVDRVRLVPPVKGQPAIVPAGRPALTKPKAMGPETVRVASMFRKEINRPLVAVRGDCRRVANRSNALKVVRRDRVRSDRGRK